MTHEQLYAALFRTVKPGAALGDPLNKRRHEATAGYRIDNNDLFEFSTLKKHFFQILKKKISNFLLKNWI